MGIVSAIGSIFSGGLDKLVLGVIDRIKLSPERKAEIEEALINNEHEIRKMELELEAKEKEYMAKEIEAASANIRAEATSGDKYTSRARPSFIYMMLVIMTCNYIIFPLLNRPVLSFPEALFWLFGSVMLGYTGARTWEKIGKTGNLFKK